MSDDIEKARAAHAALVAAKAACDAAGLSFARVWRGEDELAPFIAKAAAHVASMERRALPIAFGDSVRVCGWNSKRDRRVTNVGRTLIHLDGRATYRLDDGRATHERGIDAIDADDLARIRRDLVGKRPPKPAPTLREVGTVTTTKGGDE